MSIQTALEQRAQVLAPTLADLVRRAAARVPGFAARLAESGASVEEVGSSPGLGLLPVLSKYRSD